MKKNDITFVLNQRPTKKDFFYFLAGYNESDEIADFFDKKEDEYEIGSSDAPSIFADLIRGKTTFKKLFPQKLHTAILSKKHWDLSYLYKYEKKCSAGMKSNVKNIDTLLNNAHAELLKVYSDYFPFSVAPSDAYGVFVDLLHKSLVLLDDISFDKVHHHLSPNIQTFITPTDKTLNAFTSALKDHPKLILEGAAGTGKTTFIKYFLQKNPFLDSYYVECYRPKDNKYRDKNIYKYYLKNALSQIVYKGMGEKLPYKETYALLKEKHKYSLLVIDGMDLPSAQLAKELKTLQKLPLRIVVITRNTLDLDSNFYRFRLPDFSDKDLLDLYRSIAGIELRNVKRFLTLTHGNILIVSLLAYLSKKDHSIFNAILDDDMKITDLKGGSLEFKHPYTEHNLTLIGHIKKIYEKTFFEDEDKKLIFYLKILCCFYNIPIPIPLLQTIVPGFDIRYINTLLELGYLLSIDMDHVQMPPLIADAIYNSEKLRFSEFSEIIEEFTAYLRECDIHLTKYTVSHVLTPFVGQLQPVIRLKNNPAQQKVSKEQDTWWRFVYHCIEYCQSLGDFDSAEAIIGLLQYPDKSDILYEQSDTDKPIYSAINAWLHNTPTFPQKMDDAIDAILNLLGNIVTTDGDYRKYMPNTLTYAYLEKNKFDMILLWCISKQWCIDAILSGKDTRSIYRGYWYSGTFEQNILSSEEKNYYGNLGWLLFAPTDNGMVDTALPQFHAVALQYPAILKKIQYLTAIVSYILDAQFFRGYTGQTLDKVLDSLLDIVEEVSNFTRHTFYLCFYTFAMCKQLEVNDDIFTLDFFQSLIKKCPVLSDDEKAFCVDFFNTQNVAHIFPQPNI